MLQASRLLDLRGAEYPRRQQLEQGLRTVEHTRGAAPGDDGTVRRDLELVAFAAKRGIGAARRNADRVRLLARAVGGRHFEIQAGAGLNPPG